jgi:hypothetical protein
MTKGACLSCGRAPGGYQLSVKIDGEQAYRDPGQWVYAYREGLQQVGMCDQCFRAQRFAGLTPDEIEYFRESFESGADNEGGA